MEKGREIKPHIGIFGRRNVGKSSIINVITGQDVAIVSSHPGTTTDPVKKSIEIFGIGPVIMIDTAGIDDYGDVGLKRVKKSKQVIRSIDLALLVITDNQFNHFEESLLDEFYENGVPCLIIHNKTDISSLNPDLAIKINQQYNTRIVEFSAKHPENLDHLIDAICKTMPETAYRQKSLLADFICKGDIVLLIVPIDTEAPEGRLILPQVQAIRDILDNNCVAIVLKENEVDHFLKNTGIKPKMAICDSSVFDKVHAFVPDDIPLTGFSILLASHKGEFSHYLQGTPEIDRLKDNDRVLILESCTHHVSCDDIGRFKIPRWLEQFTGKKLTFDVVSGLNRLEKPITDYSLVIQCGGCVITRKQLVNRLKPAIDHRIPVTNYGMAIAYMQGVYDRAIEPFIKNNTNT